MIALSIRQPWAWLILHGGKNVENRTWHSQYRGPFLIHAGQTKSKDEYQAALDFIQARGIILPTPIPAINDLHYGGVIGQVTMTNCVRDYEAEGNNWFVGPYGFLLQNPIPLDMPSLGIKGRLGFFYLYPAELLTRKPSPSVYPK